MLKSFKWMLITLSLTSSIIFSGCNDSTDDIIEDAVKQTLSDSDSNLTTVVNGSNIDLTTYEEKVITDAQKYALAYMWNEERLAYNYKHYWAFDGGLKSLGVVA